MTKKIRKLAVIRSDSADGCPFGLPISYACKSVGELIYKMAPLDILGSDSTPEEKTEIAEANKHLLRWKAPEQRCPFAGKLFAERPKVVECSWGSNAKETGPGGALKGSPFFWRMFSGTGLDGLYTYPLGYYTDNSIDRGLYYGPFSIESIAEDTTNKK